MSNCLILIHLPQYLLMLFSALYYNKYKEQGVIIRMLFGHKQIIPINNLKV